MNLGLLLIDYSSASPLSDTELSVDLHMKLPERSVSTCLGPTSCFNIFACHNHSDKHCLSTVLSSGFKAHRSQMLLDRLPAVGVNRVVLHAACDFALESICHQPHWAGSALTYIALPTETPQGLLVCRRPIIVSLNTFQTALFHGSV